MRRLNLTSIKNYFIWFYVSAFFKSHMRRLGCKGHKIFRSIIKPFAVNMMRFLAAKEWSFNQTFDDQSMFSDISANSVRITRAINESISITDSSPGFKCRMIFPEFPEAGVRPTVGRAHRIAIAATRAMLANLGAILCLSCLDAIQAGRKYAAAFKARSRDGFSLLYHIITYFTHNIYSRCGQGEYMLAKAARG